MSTYPGVTGTYSNAAWQRAQLFTDGRITDAILTSCEAQVEYERTRRPSHDEIIASYRGMLAHDEKCLALALKHGNEVAARQARSNVDMMLRLLGKAQAAAEAARVADALEAV